ncbi:Uncharacterized protein Rs2_30286 [Raphanus sativus]|nr:Uncharacterized protein Rs2_30286 [Raphanus sativus]
MIRRDWRRPDSTPKGQDSLEDDVHWIVINDGSWFGVGFDHGVNHESDPLMRHMGVLETEEPCGVHGGTEPWSGWFREISPWPWLGRYKGVGRVDGELGKATSQLDHLEESWEPQVKWFSSASWMR